MCNSITILLLCRILYLSSSSRSILLWEKIGRVLGERKAEKAEREKKQSAEREKERPRFWPSLFCTTLVGRIK